MAPSDPLTKPLERWTQDDLEQLKQRRETELLELKGSETDITSDSGRKTIAKAIAGMVSASGGFIVIGTEPNKDEVTAFPGIRVTPEAIDKLRVSLYDRVRPTPLFISGPVTFDADSDDAIVLVFQVFRHPIGLPASASDRYWLRQGDSTRPMDFDEVRRRIEAAATRSGAVAERLEYELESVALPFVTEWRREYEAGGEPQQAQRYTPFAVALVPEVGSRDLGLTGRQLEEALLAAMDRDESAVGALLPSEDVLFYLRGGIDSKRSDGIDVYQVPRKRLRVSHNGVLSAAFHMIGPGSDHVTGINPKTVARTLVRVCAIGLALIHVINGPASVHVAVTSGQIPSVSFADEPGGRDKVHPETVPARHYFTSPTAGQAAVEAALAGGQVIATRVAEAGEFGFHTYVPEPPQREYLERMLI